MLTQMDSGELTPFGAALDNIGFCGTYNLDSFRAKSDHDFRSTARVLKYVNVYEPSMNIKGHPLPDQDLSFTQVLEPLKMAHPMPALGLSFPQMRDSSTMALPLPLD